MSEFGEQSGAAVPTGEFSMPRGVWMATIGKDIYGRYFQWLVDQLPPRHQTPEVSVRSPYHAIARIAELSACYLSYADAWTPDNPLFDHEAEIMHYTAAEELGDARQTNNMAILRHNLDTVRFGFTLSARVANEAVFSANQGYKSRDTVFRAGAATMRNIQFNRVLDALASTGFSVLGPSSSYGPGSTWGLEGLRSRLDLPEDENLVEIQGSVEKPEDLQAAGIVLHPLAIKSLKEKRSIQNKDMEKAVVQAGGPRSWDFLPRHTGEKHFSIGCPVAHGPTFGVLSHYLADALDLTNTFMAENSWEVGKEVKGKGSLLGRFAAVHLS